MIMHGASLESSVCVFGLVSDEELVSKANSGDQIAIEVLLNKYKNFVRSKARTYFLVGAEREDIIQEGMIGLFKAVRDFNPEKTSSFKAFAELCVTRQIITAIKTATRQKHLPLNSYVSLSRPVFEEDSERTLVDILVGNQSNDPETLIIDKEDFDIIGSKMVKALSEFEWDVLNSYLQGKTYLQIAQEMDKHIKSIDNALQRVKRKISALVSEIKKH